MSYPGGNGWPEQPQQPQPYLKTYPQPYQQPYEQSELYQPYQQYQQYGGYPGGPPPPKKSRTGFWIGIGALVLVIAVGVTLLIVLTGKNKVDQQAAARDTSAPGGPPSPPPASTSAPSSTIQPSIAGWQGVAASGENVAYDVPPDWKVETSDTLTGFENASLPLATMHSVATYKADEGCPARRAVPTGRTPA